MCCGVLVYLDALTLSGFPVSSWLATRYGFLGLGARSDCLVFCNSMARFTGMGFGFRLALIAVTIPVTFSADRTSIAYSHLARSLPMVFWSLMTRLFFLDFYAGHDALQVLDCLEV